MHDNHALWLNWANNLRRYHLQDLAALFLEAAAPLRILAAQLLYAGIPLVDAFSPSRTSWLAMANLLEDSQESQSFIALLREEV
ncbi:MAG: hypothetical protein AB1453_12170 [Chloroflexota bacterium]|jgi:hypothetical protein